MLTQLAAVATPYSVGCFSCSGFDSLTAKKMLASRICEIGKPAVILHLGDYDPSGEALFRAVAEDVAAFVEADRPWATVTVEFRRVALTAEQVRLYDLPTQPPKASDSRSRSWRGATCQLEALPPDVIADLLEAAIVAELDASRLRADVLREAVDRQRIAFALPAPEQRP